MSEASQNVRLDGAVLEGGGQILRNAVALSALTNNAVTIERIRANRSKPGLKAQHLCGIQLVASIAGVRCCLSGPSVECSYTLVCSGVNTLCKADLKGGSLHSEQITFTPGLKTTDERSSPHYYADVKTAGSICLLIQVALPPLLFHPTTAGEYVAAVLKGGTNAAMAPQVDYFTDVFCPTIRRMGVDALCNIKKRGYFPRGGGEVELLVKPLDSIQPIVMDDRGHVERISIRAFTAGRVPDHVAHRMIKTALITLKRAGYIPKGTTNSQEEGYQVVDISHTFVKEQNAVGDGTGIMLTATTSEGCIIAGSALGERRKKAEDVGREAAQFLVDNLLHGGCVDEYLQDQLIIFMALASGQSRVRCGPLSLHTKTAIYVVSRFTNAKFSITDAEGERHDIQWLVDGTKVGNGLSNVISCDGVGWRNQHVSQVDHS